ncbi:MAG: sulfite exporter TauE/SafE family protein [Pseudorhodoplanes sp.]|nr:sulfite exporter TauE/SafE family protein [Pseudorhodoplanes sp.]
MDSAWWLFFGVGMAAQLVDGALGMAFGVTATTFMLSFGTPPAQASAMVHIAEIFTTAASGASHWKQRNIDWAMVRRLAIPGTIGGGLGATLLANVDGRFIAPFVSAYLAVMGCVIIVKAVRRVQRLQPSWRGIPVIGFLGGLLDAIGGGGWGPIVTSSLIGGGHTPRLVIGSVNLTEFLVTVVTSAAFAVSLGFADILPVVPLILGGLIVAPFAGYLTRIVPTRILMLVVGCLVLGLSIRSILKVVGAI